MLHCDHTNSLSPSSYDLGILKPSQFNKSESDKSTVGHYWNLLKLFLTGTLWVRLCFFVRKLLIHYCTYSWYRRWKYTSLWWLIKDTCKRGAIRYYNKTYKYICIMQNTKINLYCKFLLKCIDSRSLCYCTSGFLCF